MITVADSHNPLTWGNGCGTIDGVREVPLRLLAPGQRFEVVMDATSGQRYRGTVVRQTSCSIAVEMDTWWGSRNRSFTTAEGEVIQLTRGGGTTLSPDTPVLVLAKGQEPRRGNHMGERVAGLPGIGTNGATKAKPKVAAKPAPAAKAKAVAKSLNPCGCGCGERVTGRFRQGHDSRYYSLLKKVQRKELDFSKLPRLMQETVKNTAGINKALAAHG